MFTRGEKIRFLLGWFACTIDVYLALVLMWSAIIPSVYRDWRDEATLWHVLKKMKKAREAHG